MKKRILAILAITFLMCNNSQTNYKIVIDGIEKVYKAKFPLLLAKYQPGQWLLKSWAASSTPIFLWAMPAQLIVASMIEKVFSSHNSEIAQLQKEHAEKIVNLQNESMHKQVTTAAITATALISLLALNKYKNNIAQLFRKKTNPKPTIQSILQDALTAQQAIQQLKLHGYTKTDVQSTRIQACKFSSQDIQQIIHQLH